MVEPWLNRLESWFLREGVVDDRARALYLLENVDFSLWEEVKDLEGKGHAEIKKEFLTLYGKPKVGTAHIYEYYGLFQGENEKAGEFWDRVRKTIRLSLPTLKGEFLRAWLWISS